MIKNNKLRPYTFYEMLGLHRGSSAQDIRVQYEKLKNVYTMHNPLMRELYDTETLYIYNRLLDSVQQFMLDPELRREYDMTDENDIESLEQSFPENFDIREVMRRYNRQKRQEKPVKRDVFGREAEKADTGNTFSEINTTDIFDKYVGRTFTGEVLKQLRDEMGITMKALAERTKISNFVLKAIEEDNYAHLPAETYVRGFLKIYCRALRLSADQTELITSDYVAVMSGRKSKDIVQ